MHDYSGAPTLYCNLHWRVIWCLTRLRSWILSNLVQKRPGATIPCHHGLSMHSGRHSYSRTNIFRKWNPRTNMLRYPLPTKMWAQNFIAVTLYEDSQCFLRVFTTNDDFGGVWYVQAWLCVNKNIDWCIEVSANGWDTNGVRWLEDLFIRSRTSWLPWSI